MLRLYSATLLLSAALLMTVQPLAAKMVLPLLGGAPEVWNTCMVFFQGLLLLGYGYSHLTTRLLGVRRQALLHLALLLAQLAWLPLSLPADAVPPSATVPIPWLLGILSLAVGGPFLMVATTAPLLQRWFAETRHAASTDPYFLYVASNLGSMTALVGFPLVMEPLLQLDQQAWFWSAGYGLLTALIGCCAFVVWRSPPRLAAVGAAGGSADDRRELRGSSGVAVNTDSPPMVVDWRRRGSWLVLSFIPSSWLLGVTNDLTTDIAPVPLLWIVPLALYLLTFVLVFARRPLAPHAWVVRLFPVALLLLVESILITVRWPVLLLHLGVFFWGALACHGELARQRPAVTHLTEFYLWMSLGGVLGGIFNAIIAPLVFPWLIEYPLATALAAIILARVDRPLANAPRSPQKPAAREARDSRAAQDTTARRLRIGMLLGVLGVLALASRSLASVERPVALVVVVAVATLAAAVLYLVDQPRWLALVVAIPLVMDQIAPPFSGELLFTARSYFGVHRVLATRNEDGEVYHYLVHGGTVHGRQARWPEREGEPLTYYHRQGPLGQAFARLEWPARRRVAIVGLGSGAMACYCEANDVFTFFEIDPQVRRIAQSPEYFSYLARGARGSCAVELGDGRLRLAACDDASFDLIVLDAFSSDAVPVHLLTAEALRIYLRKLTPDGVLLFHVSNQYLELERVLGALATDAQLACLVCRDERISQEDLAAGRAPSTYVAIAREARRLEPLARRADWRPPAMRPGQRGWTDGYSNILSVLRW